VPSGGQSHPTIYHKAVESSVLYLIKQTGLDPTHAGGLGSLTSTAALHADRPYNEHDRTGQFLTPSEDFAGAYAEGFRGTGVMLRVTLSPALLSTLVKRSEQEYIATDKITHDAIEYECARGRYAPLRDWDGKRRSLHCRDSEESEDDSSSDD
jgi:hypothetical protein